MSKDRTRLHGTAVAFGDAGVLIIGAAGSGKSTLAFDLLSRGAALIADDQVDLTADRGQLWLSAPSATAGLIEARGVGLIRMVHIDQCKLHLVVDLDGSETQRLPERRSRVLLGQSVPVIFGARIAGLAAILAVLMDRGTVVDPDSDTIA